MRNIKRLLALPIPVLLLLIGGCVIVSGTFVIVEDFTFTANSGSYFYQVDITEEPDWKDNKDKINFVDAVGMELYFDNQGTTPATFNVWIDEYSGPEVGVPTRPGTATQIIADLTVPVGVTQITYVESLKYLINVNRLKQLAFAGQFNVWGESSGANGTFEVTKGKVIVTFSGGS